MSLRRELIQAARAAKGSLKTVENRCAVVRRFVDFLQAQNIQIRAISQIKAKYLEAYIRAGLERGLKPRTLQSEASALRTTLVAAGREQLAANLDNQKLGIANASRDGTKTALGEDRFTEILAKAAEKDAGVAACIALQRALGLREKEAVMSPPSLASWQRALSQGKPVKVIFGTKGGRPRDVLPADRVRALAAVRAALALSRTQQGRLVDKSHLKSALDRYGYVLRCAGATGMESGHSLRYSFARERFQHYQSQGFSDRESLALVAVDLGHGDARGRWVEQVYLK